MSAEKIAKEALYQRAVEIAADCFAKAGYCIHEDRNKCHRKDKNCMKCIKLWLVRKVANEISFACGSEAWEVGYGKKHNADG